MSSDDALKTGPGEPTPEADGPEAQLLEDLTLGDSTALGDFGAAGDFGASGDLALGDLGALGELGAAGDLGALGELAVEIFSGAPPAAPNAQESSAGPVAVEGPLVPMLPPLLAVQGLEGEVAEDVLEALLEGLLGAPQGDVAGLLGLDEGPADTSVALELEADPEGCMKRLEELTHHPVDRVREGALQLFFQLPGVLAARATGLLLEWLSREPRLSIALQIARFLGALVPQEQGRRLLGRALAESLEGGAWLSWLEGLPQAAAKGLVEDALEAPVGPAVRRRLEALVAGDH